MCGRAAQTHRAVHAAALVLGEGSSSSNSSSRQAPQQDRRDVAADKDEQQEETDSWTDNYNMSPGMGARVFCLENDELVTHEKVWGLVPRGGTPKAPLQLGMSLHFSNRMFNARSDTLYEKRTFSGLLSNNKTCLMAIDGFFEWKAPKLKGDKKQPYYVYHKNDDKKHPFLLLAGLWTTCTTGRDGDNLDTFTVVTTDVCPSLQWLHHRMPLMIWDEALALQWLRHPTPQLLKEMEKAAWNTDRLSWHAVTPQMSQTSFRSKDGIKPLPPPATVKSFFAVKRQQEDSRGGVTSSSPTKKRPPAAESSKSLPKPKRTATPQKKSKGSIENFFSPKQTK